MKIKPPFTIETPRRGFMRGSYIVFNSRGQRQQVFSHCELRQQQFALERQRARDQEAQEIWFPKKK